VHRVVETPFLTAALNLSVRACVITCLTLLFTGLYAFSQEAAPSSGASGAVSQTKTLDYVAKFITTKGAVGNSLIYDNGTNVGVGTTTPGSTLDVNGTINAVTGYNLGGNAFSFGSFTNANAFFGFAGNSTMTGTSNTASGLSALQANTTGDWNTGVGGGALEENTEGHSNAAVGLLAVYQNTTGNYNAAIGNRSLEDNTTGGSNAAVGYQALYENTTGGNNTGIGIFSGQTIDASSVTGSNNTTLGTGTALGTGSINNATALGANAVVNESNALVLGCVNGVNNCTGGVDVGIGESTPSGPLHITGPAEVPPGGLSAAHNGLLLGTNGTSSYKWIQSYGGALAINQAGVNGVGIGTTTPDMLLSVNGGADKPGGGSWGTYSDGRLKNVNGSFASGLSQILQLHPVRYRYKPDNALGIRDTEEHIGVVAQDVRLPARQQRSRHLGDGERGQGTAASIPAATD
jgi:hypothetical protein